MKSMNTSEFSNPRSRVTPMHFLHGLYLLLYLSLFTPAGGVPLNPFGTNNEIASLFSSGTSLHARLANQTVQWGSCGNGLDNFQCANISVPLDYSNDTDPRTATIFVNRLPASNTTNRLGSLFINPGGPGVSGSEANFVMGQNLSAVLKDQYDIIGFDPRGIQQSDPYVSCFNNLLEEVTFSCNTKGFRLNIPSNVTSDVVQDLNNQLVNVTSQTSALSAQCFDRLGDTVKFFGTDFVVRDIDTLSRLIDGETVPINYWGWSYGSAIGQYMTQILPPERINRMIIDGIVDVVGWSGYPIQPYNITDDMDHILQEFADSCASAGDACVLSNLTSSQILSLIDSTLDELYYSPPLATDLGPGYGSVEVDAGVLRFALFESMYLMLSWPTLAELLAETFAGNYTSLVQAIVPAISPTYVTMRDDSSYATSMIYCNDAKPYDASHPPPSIEQLTDNVVLALNQNSRRLGEFLYGLGLCQFWQDVMPSQSHYNGTFDIAPGTLQTPMLVFSQTFDPVTDLANALRSSERLGDNARLCWNGLIQQVDGYGHCTISQTSFCALPIVQAYMLDGAVPDSNHTLCQVDQLPFKPFDEQDAVNRTEGLDLESRQAWVALGLSWAKLAAA